MKSETVATDELQRRNIILVQWSDIIRLDKSAPEVESGYAYAFEIDDIVEVVLDNSEAGWIIYLLVDYSLGGILAYPERRFSRLSKKWTTTLNG